MLANEAKLLNEVLPANPLLNQLLQFLSTRNRQINASETTRQEENPSLYQGGLCKELICLKSQSPCCHPSKPLELPSAFHRTFPCSPVTSPSYLLPVILKGIVIVVDGNAKQKRTQALDKLLLFPKVFSYLPCELELLIRTLEIVHNHNTCNTSPCTHSLLFTHQPKLC